MIRVEELRAGYRTGFARRWRDVLDGVSFHVEPGSVTGYLGVNGAGKTTTIKVLVGINPPSGGQAFLGSHPVGSTAAQRLLGYFPEAPFFYDGLTALELLDFFGKLHGIDRGQRTKRAAALLNEVGLEDAVDQPIRGYSKGMRQRLGLAQALVHDPKLLILDEPLDGLDPMGRLHLRQLISDRGERGTTVFFSSHVLNDVEVVCDHLVVLDGGKIAYQGATDGIGADVDPTVDLIFGGVEADALALVGEAAGAKPTKRGDGSYGVLCSSQSAADATVDAVRAAGGRILSLATRRPSLEETFLERFGKSPKDTPQPEPVKEAG